MSDRCDAELCPYWDGDTCPCATFGIDPPGPGADPARLPSATYVRDSSSAGGES